MQIPQLLAIASKKTGGSWKSLSLIVMTFLQLSIIALCACMCNQTLDWKDQNYPATKITFQTVLSELIYQT